MGVYIKGVNIPKRRAIDLCIHPDGTLVVFPENGLAYDTKVCEVPEPHGRLTDADALKVAIHEADFYYDSTEEKCKRHDIGRLVHALIDGIIDESPTVIEAEEG